MREKYRAAKDELNAIQGGRVAAEVLKQQFREAYAEAYLSNTSKARALKDGRGAGAAARIDRPRGSLPRRSSSTTARSRGCCGNEGSARRRC